MALELVHRETKPFSHNGGSLTVGVDLVKVVDRWIRLDNLSAARTSRRILVVSNNKLMKLIPVGENATAADIRQSYLDLSKFLKFGWNLYFLLYKIPFEVSPNCSLSKYDPEFSKYFLDSKSSVLFDATKPTLCMWIRESVLKFQNFALPKKKPFFNICFVAVTKMYKIIAMWCTDLRQ